MTAQATDKVLWKRKKHEMSKFICMECSHEYDDEELSSQNLFCDNCGGRLELNDFDVENDDLQYAENLKTKMKLFVKTLKTKKKLFIKTLKICGVIVIPLLGAVGLFLGYEYYKDEAELAYEAEMGHGTFFDNVDALLDDEGRTEKWAWHSKENRVQISTRSPYSVMRKVHLNEEPKYIVFAYKDDDYVLNAEVNFLVKCTPDTEIITTKTFSSGAAKTLTCNSEGNALMYSVVWNGEMRALLWREDLDGFSVDEHFYYWDFTQLDDEIFLSKAK